MKKEWFQKAKSSQNSKFRFRLPIIFLVKKLQNRPGLRNVLGPVLRRIPIPFSFKHKTMRPLSIEWRLEDELLELVEQMEASTLLFLQTDLRPDIIFDLGASCGISTHFLSAQHQAARLIAYEPRPKAFARLQSRLQKLPGSHVAHLAAVGTRSGVIALKDQGVGTGLADQEEGSFTSTLVTLNEAVISDRTKKVVLKIDVEGGEKDLLPWVVSRLPEQSVILLETHQALDEVESYACSSLSAGFRWTLLRYREMPEYGGPFADWILTGPMVQFRF
jgi:FkbM family methyltransferase